MDSLFEFKKFLDENETRGEEEKKPTTTALVDPHLKPPAELAVHNFHKLQAKLLLQNLAGAPAAVNNLFRFPPIFQVPGRISSTAKKVLKTIENLHKSYKNWRKESKKYYKKHKKQKEGLGRRRRRIKRRFFK